MYTYHTDLTNANISQSSTWYYEHISSSPHLPASPEMFSYLQTYFIIFLPWFSILLHMYPSTTYDGFVSFKIFISVVILLICFCKFLLSPNILVNISSSHLTKVIPSCTLTTSVQESQFPLPTQWALKLLYLWHSHSEKWYLNIILIHVAQVMNGNEHIFIFKLNL